MKRAGGREPSGRTTQRPAHVFVKEPPPTQRAGLPERVMVAVRDMGLPFNEGACDPFLAPLYHQHGVVSICWRHFSHFL